MFVWVKSKIKLQLLRRKYAESVLHRGVMCDRRTNLSKDCVLFPNVTVFNSNIGDRTYIQQNSVVLSASIGKYCSIASDVIIGLANHPIDMVSTSPIFYDNSQPLPFFFTKDKKHESLPKTTVGSDVWIGQGALIKAGVEIGVGAIIGAGAVVVRNIEPYSIVGGVPARHLKWRFDSYTRAKLLNSKWWTLDDETLSVLSPYFNEPLLFLDKIEGA